MNLTKQVVIRSTGGPEVLEFESVALGDPGPGQAKIRNTAIGLNYIDTYFRTGLYPAPAMPTGLGFEAAGVVEAIGDGVDFLNTGDRVAYCSGPLGAYSEERLMPAERLAVIPEGIADETAAAMMLKGCTAQYLLRQTHKVMPGETILFHAAAGGVGLIACQWAKALGATVIGTVSSEEKAKLARAHGCDHIIMYKEESVSERVMEITGGAKLPVVYDGVGKTTFMDSLDSLRPRGLMVSFGNASGAVDAFNVGLLTQKGSLFLTRPSLAGYTATREEFLACANDLFDVVKSGKVNIEINQTFKLDDVADAHRALEGRQTTGSTIIKP